MRRAQLLMAMIVIGLASGLGLFQSRQARAQVDLEADPKVDDPLGYVVDREDLDDPIVIAAGEELYEVGCASCHGPAGVGGDCPDLREAGAASAHFFLTSGRMPAADTRGQSFRKPSPYTPEQIEALVAYVAAVGNGPPIPDVSPARGDLAEGGELFRLNCAACHQAAGAGGALSYGNNAPPLDEATAVQVADVLPVGPGQMPQFTSFSQHEVDSIVKYVLYLQDLESPGGFALGRVGPIPEGFVAIGVGLGALVTLTFWVGRRRKESEVAEPEASDVAEPEASEPVPPGGS